MSIAVTAADVMQAEVTKAGSVPQHFVPAAAALQPGGPAAAAAVLGATPEAAVSLRQSLMGIRDVFLSWLRQHSNHHVHSPASSNQYGGAPTLMHSSINKDGYASNHVKHIEAAATAEVAANLFGVMANIAFCRVPDISLSSDLTSQLLPFLQGDSSHGCQLLLDLLPCYLSIIHTARPSVDVPLHLVGPPCMIPTSHLRNITNVVSHSATLSAILEEAGHDRQSL
jgi:hypothetical protein